MTGFTDAEGCFTVSFLKNSTAFRLRYIISQKGEINLFVLQHLILLFKTGNIEPHYIKSVYSFIISGAKACYNIYNYFDNFPLKTKKLDSYLRWKNIHKQITNKAHLNPELRIKLIELATKVNSVKT